VAASAALLRISPALAHHAAGALFYSVGPVALFLWCYRLSSDRIASFAAALLYSLVSPSALLLRSVALDMQSPWRDRRLDTLVRYGDGPHVAALALVPLALIAFDAVLEKGGALRACWAALMLALVVLTNWLGAVALALALLSYLLARFGELRWLRNVAISAGIGLLAYAVASPLIPPSAIADVRRNAQFIGGNFPMGKAQLAGCCLVATAAFALSWLFARWKLSRIYRFALLFLLFTGALRT
jgi:uncharacterized membrane protein